MKFSAGLSLAILPALTLFAAPRFTIDDVLSSPFPDNLVASPGGDAVAWVMNARGVRNIWVARSPAYKASPITSFTGDDGQEISELSWRADSSAVVFTRGDGPNARGEFPNPRSDPAGVHQEIWIATVSGGARKLADGHSAAVSPNGSVVAWVLNGQIWSLSVESSAPPAQLIHARGSARTLAWSPDGKRLAFVGDRGDHGFIGVFSAAEKSLRFLDPSVDTDQSPVWSPDGKQVAFIRLPALAGEFEYGAKRTGDPWSIRVADAESGVGRELWRAAEGRGSVFWPLRSENQLFWMADGRLLFPWERDGWLHLYATSVRSGGATLLSPGDFEIEQVAETRDRKAIVFSSNQGDPDRRHLWRVEAGTSAPRPVTSGNGIEWSPVPLIDGEIALLHSDSRLPARPALRQNSGAVRDLTPGTLPSTFPASAMTEPQPVGFSARDGMNLHGQLFLPPDANAGKHPAVVFFHGGSRRQMLLGWHYMSYYHQTYGFNQYLASKGYIVLSVNYRSGTGYGSDFREARDFGPTGASEFADILAAGAYLRSRPDVDPARIGAWGGSYGGYLTALALARASNLFAAGVDLHGVHDWNLEVTSVAPARDREKREAIVRLAFQSSPMASIATWRSPVLLIQGDDDRTVAFAQTVQLVEALRTQGVKFEQLIFPDEVHDFLMYSHWLSAFQAADDFLLRYLKP